MSNPDEKGKIKIKEIIVIRDKETKKNLVRINTNPNKINKKGSF